VRIIRVLVEDNLITFNINVIDVALKRGCIEIRNDEFGTGGGGGLFSNITIVTALTLNPLLVIK
jgi:hypothetical protein